MVDILHEVSIRVNPTEAYAALTTLDGLRGWWTEDTDGIPGEVGGVIQFRFPAGGFDMEVAELVPGQRVTWTVVDGPEEWVGTTIEWTLRAEGEWTSVLFGHLGWAEPVEFMHHCSTKWATFLLSLRDLVESGAGAPSPRDVKITYWEMQLAG
jgi:uncharacterized protein YndB with AHSA1/START domain